MGILSSIVRSTHRFGVFYSFCLFPGEKADRPIVRDQTDWHICTGWTAGVNGLVHGDERIGE